MALTPPLLQSTFSALKNTVASVFCSRDQWQSASPIQIDRAETIFASEEKGRKRGATPTFRRKGSESEKLIDEWAWSELGLADVRSATNRSCKRSGNSGDGRGEGNASDQRENRSSRSLEWREAAL